MILEVLFVFLIVFSFVVVEVRQLIHALLFLTATTMLLVAVLFILRAPDVAITQAVVGSGATSVIYLLVLRKVEVIKS